jgi:hypothetical protein
MMPIDLLPMFLSSYGYYLVIGVTVSFLFSQEIESVHSHVKIVI